MAGSRYTQNQKLKFRFSTESGYRICQFLNIVYNGLRPAPVPRLWLWCIAGSGLFC
jgi:hypothetical protein